MVPKWVSYEALSDTWAVETAHIGPKRAEKTSTGSPRGPLPLLGENNLATFLTHFGPLFGGRVRTKTPQTRPNGTSQAKTASSGAFGLRLRGGNHQKWGLALRESESRNCDSVRLALARPVFGFGPRGASRAQPGPNWANGQHPRGGGWVQHDQKAADTLAG